MDRMTKEQWIEWLGKPEEGDDYAVIGQPSASNCLFSFIEDDGDRFVAITPKDYFESYGYLFDGSIHVYELYEAGFVESMESVFYSPFDTDDITREYLLGCGFSETKEFDDFCMCIFPSYQP